MARSGTPRGLPDIRRVRRSARLRSASHHPRRHRHQHDRQYSPARVSPGRKRGSGSARSGRAGSRLQRLERIGNSTTMAPELRDPERFSPQLRMLVISAVLGGASTPLFFGLVRGPRRAVTPLAGGLLMRVAPRTDARNESTARTSFWASRPCSLQRSHSDVRSAGSRLVPFGSGWAAGPAASVAPSVPRPRLSPQPGRGIVLRLGDRSEPVCVGRIQLDQGGCSWVGTTARRTLPHSSTFRVASRRPHGCEMCDGAPRLSRLADA